MSRVFKEFNQNGNHVCPICKTNDKKEVILIAKEGTQEGFNAEAIQCHVDCIDLWYSQEMELIYQRVGVNK